MTTETASLTLADIKSAQSLEQLLTYKKTYYSHRKVRQAIDNELSSQSLQGREKAFAQWITGKHAEAVDSLETCTDGLELYIKANCLFETSRFADAATTYEKSKNAGGPSQAVFGIIENLILSGDYEKAGSTLASASGDEAELEYCKGLLADKNGRHEEALDHFEKALSINPEHRYALFNIAWISERFGDDDRAIEYYEKCREIMPVLLSCLINLGILYEDNGKLQEATYCFEEVLDTDPNNERAKLYLNDVNHSFNMQYDEESERQYDYQNSLLQMKISDFELSVRSRNCLERMGIHTIGELVQKSEVELLSYPNFGETSLTEIKEILVSKNIQLGMPLKPPSYGGRPEAPSAETTDPKLMTPIATLKLSVRSTKVLETLGVQNLGQLIQFNEEQLMAQKNFGSTSIREIKSKLSEYGLELAPSLKAKNKDKDLISAETETPADTTAGDTPAEAVESETSPATEVSSPSTVKTLSTPETQATPVATPPSETGENEAAENASSPSEG